MQRIDHIQEIELIEPLKIDEDFNEEFNLEEISINGYVEVINGDTDIKANNKLVQSILAWYANMTSMNYVYNAVPSGASWVIGTYNWNMYLGTDPTNTTTSYNTIALASPIGTAPGTAPNTLSGTTTNPSNGVFNIIFTGTWGAGTVSGTVREMALYLNILSSLQGFGWVKNANNVTETAQLASRLAVADGAFSPFTINTANPLTINWTYQLSFS